MWSGGLATLSDDQTIVITGFMGTGKSTIAARLSKRLRRPLMDTDAEIVVRAGMPIADIFAAQGEAAFRALERELCRAIAASTGLVVATGGGMLVDPENRRIVTETCWVVCLEAAPSVLEARLSRSIARPLAKDWRALLEARRDAYAAIPVHIDTSSRSPDDTVEEIIRLWSHSR
jgi:shikimate kinase